MKPAKQLLVAVDDGYAQMKIFGEPSPTPPAADTRLKTDARGRLQFVMKSAIAVGKRGLGTIDGKESVDAWETEEGQAFTVSDSIQTEGTRFDGFHYSEIDRVLINQALYSAGYGGQQVSLVAGLPVANFFKDGMRNDENIDKKRANLMKKVKLISGSGPIPEIVDVQIGCQAVAAYVDWLLDDDLKEVQEADSRVAIVDIGGRTTDIAVVIGGSQIDHDRSGTANVGVLDVYAAIEKKIHSKFGIDDKLTLAYLADAVRDKSIKVYGKPEDISDMVLAAIAEQEQKIKLECERKLQSAATLDAVIFVGGGSALFENLPQQFRNGVLTPNPEIANARGMWKFFRWKERMAAAAKTAPKAAE